MKIFSIILLVVMVGFALMMLACDEDAPPAVQLDQCLRVKLYHECLDKVPQGPHTTKYNDWDEVIAQCDNDAYYQSLRPAWAIKAECRVER